MPNTVAKALRFQGQNDSEQLRRDILESVLKGREQANLAQTELERQGDKLKDSIGKASQVATQTNVTVKAVDRLIDEARATKTRKIFQCCLYTCCYCCRDKTETNTSTRLETEQNAFIARDEVDNEEETSYVRLDVLRKDLKNKDSVGWRRTLSPLPGISYGAPVCRSRVDIWHRQMDASLTHLQHVAEDMNRSLDEQIKLAQMLTIYLNYGIDQVTGANDRLVAEKGLKF